MPGSPSTLLRERVRTIFETEFATEGWTVADDKLVRAAGKDGSTEVAVYPEDESPNPQRYAELQVECVLQLYLAYEAVPEEHLVVDPTIIEGYGDRLRKACQGNQSGNDSDFWFFNVTSIHYPDDPTGNKSRLEATFVGRCQNPAALP